MVSSANSRARRPDRPVCASVASRHFLTDAATLLCEEGNRLSRCIIYIAMKRTQLYLDDDIARILSTMSRQRGQTVSELVRECIREKFGGKEKIDKAELARQLGGVWKDRKDLGGTKRYVRRLRADTRRQRLKNG